ncbi:MAG: CD225/dispanin family protein [Thermoguttaceae bacterium]|nr:CD225/dispanin family protein [Thermoguttaceae bacterium]
MICRQCGVNNVEGSRFCFTCGAELRNDAFCSRCGVVLPPGALVCSQCGTRVGMDASAAGYSSPAADCSAIPDYLVWNILATIFCCNPFGIVGIIYSILCRAAKQNANIDAASNASNVAKIWFIVALIYGIVQIFGARAFISLCESLPVSN